MVILKKLRAKKLSSILKSYIKRNQKVIDIGSGDCILVENIKETTRANITACDRDNFSKNGFPVVVIENNSLPFNDQHFDVAILAFTLHYCKDPLSILNETKRVAKRIIILEDIAQNLLEKFFYKIWGKISNTGRSSDYNFPSVLTFKDINNFAQTLNLEIEHQKKIKISYSLFLIRHSLFVLKKT